MRKNVQVYIYAQTDEKLLLLKRTPERSGYWQPVCGGIEHEETLVEAGLREVFEETGISTYQSLHVFDETYVYQEPKDGVLMEMKDQCLLMTIDRICEVKLSDEHEQFEWCRLKSVGAYTDWLPIIETVERISRRFGLLQA